MLASYFYLLTDSSRVLRSSHILVIVWIGVSLCNFVVKLEVVFCGEIYSFGVLNWMRQLRVETILICCVLDSSQLVTWVNI